MQTCDHCGGPVSSYENGCPTCGAPNCCKWCCDEAATLEADAAREMGCEDYYTMTGELLGDK